MKRLIVGLSRSDLVAEELVRTGNFGFKRPVLFLLRSLLLSLVLRELEKFKEVYSEANSVSIAVRGRRIRNEDCWIGYLHRRRSRGEYERCIVVLRPARLQSGGAKQVQ